MERVMSKDQQKNAEPADEGVLIAARREKLRKWREELGIEAYGGRVDGLISLAEARGRFDAAADEAYKAASEGAKAAAKAGGAAWEVRDGRPRALTAGRCVQHRNLGKLVFMLLRDESGDLQVSVSKAAVGEKSFELAAKLDYGDIVVAEGPVGKTKTGEVCVWAERFEVHCKSLTPPPEKYHGLTDEELRYRQRYVDLYANPESMRLLKMRSRIVTEVRRFMEGKGYLEVETPMLQAIHGGAAARPFATHHHALDMELYLRIAPELYLKRLLVGGFRKVFELNRNFRNEGISPKHNPEFTMLEAYEAYGNWETMAELVEEMICEVAGKVCGGLRIEHRSAAGDVVKVIDLKRPWKRARMEDLVEEKTGWKFEKKKIQEAERNFARVKGMYAEKASGEQGKAEAFGEQLMKLTAAEQLVEVFEKLVEPTLIDPCFVTRVPSVVIPLARECADDAFFADVYELVINGQEISPGYTELNDPEVQERHFKHQVGDREEQQKFDEDFVNALRVGMPPAGGMGMGIDRLVMTLTGAESIRDVIAFPLMRPPSSAG